MSLHIAIIRCNRAAQLEMLLASLAAHAPPAPVVTITVLFDTTTDAFALGYDVVRGLHPHVQYERQRLASLNQQFVDCAREGTAEFFSLFADDLVAVRPFSPTDHEFSLLRTRSDIAALSLRLNPRVDYSQPLDMKVAPPPLGKDRRGVGNRAAAGSSRLGKTNAPQGPTPPTGQMESVTPLTTPA